MGISVWLCCPKYALDSIQINFVFVQIVQHIELSLSSSFFALLAAILRHSICSAFPWALKLSEPSLCSWPREFVPSNWGWSSHCAMGLTSSICPREASLPRPILLLLGWSSFLLQQTAELKTSTPKLPLQWAPLLEAHFIEQLALCHCEILNAQNLRSRSQGFRH